MRHRTILLVAGMAVLLSSCADAATPITPFTGPWAPAEGIPTKLALTCRADGSIALSDERVQAQPDGVHLRVENEYDEPVSVGGFDADPGSSTWTFGAAPGPFALAGYPEEDNASVIVVRDGEAIASFGFVRFEDRPWSVAGGTVCDGSGLRAFDR